MMILLNLKIPNIFFKHKYIIALICQILLSIWKLILLSKSELVKILLMKIVTLYLTVKLVVLSLSTKWNSKIYVTKCISKGILLIFLVVQTY